MTRNIGFPGKRVKYGIIALNRFLLFLAIVLGGFCVVIWWAGK